MDTMKMPVLDRWFYKISLHYFLPHGSIDLIAKNKWYGVTTAPVSC